MSNKRDNNHLEANQPNNKKTKLETEISVNPSVVSDEGSKCEFCLLKCLTRSLYKSHLLENHCKKASIQIKRLDSQLVKVLERKHQQRKKKQNTKRKR